MVVYSVLELFMRRLYCGSIFCFGVVYEFMRRLYCGSIFCFGVVYEEVVLW